MAESPPPPKGMVLTHFIVSDDVEPLSALSDTEVLGGRARFGPVPINVALANSFIVIHAGGGPDRRQAYGHPGDATRSRLVSSFLNIWVHRHRGRLYYNGAPGVLNS